jgi:3-hydroxyisobutyrate dehydrogenase-like beta-hydroxyacid dehydrogenase
MNVGFIDLGHIGLPMARNLAKAGHRVVVWDRTRSRAEELRAEELRDEGAEVADTRAGACKGDIVITMLANDNAVEEVVLDSGRVISALRQNAIHLSMSTISVALSEELTAAHHAAAQDFVAAPVFGGAWKPWPPRSSLSSQPANRTRLIAPSRCSTTSGKRHLLHGSAAGRSRPPQPVS